MNIAEGSRRMRKAGRSICIAGIASFVFFIGLLVTSRMILSGEHILFGVIYLSLPTIACGSALWIVGYVVEGFGKEPSS